MAAEQGFADAQFNLAVMYTQGYGVDRDENEAAKWLRFAARQGNVDAQFNLGILYRNGWSVVPDERQVGWWLSLAADQGHVEAQFKLGVMYLQGKFDPDGVALSENLIRAHLCLNLAALSGNADAAKAREIVACNMTPEEVTEAQRLAQEWKPKTRNQSALEIYEADVEEFFQSLKAGPSEVAPTDTLKLLDRADDLIDVGVSLGEPAGNQLKTLRAVHHALATELEKAVPQIKDTLTEINALKEIRRSPGLRPWLKRPK